MKKIALFLITIITLVIAISSCKKSSSPTIIGTWGLFFYQKTMIDSAVLPFQYVSDTTFADQHLYVYKFNSNNTFTLTDSFPTPAIIYAGTFSLLPNNQLRIVGISPVSYIDTVGYGINGNELQITITGSSPGNSFREVDSYNLQ
jgi:hypothetical protein